MSSRKPYCIGDITSNLILSRYDNYSDAVHAVENNDQLVFHESHAEKLGMTDKSEPVEFSISSSQAYGNARKNPGVFGTAKFTATAYHEEKGNVFGKPEDYSVQVIVTFDPYKKTWNQPVIVNQWKGRF